MTKYVFGNFETEFDPTDVAFVQKYEDAAEKYSSKIQSVPRDGKASQIIMNICTVFYDVFDSLFGAGTSKKMFGDTNSVGLCTKAFKMLIDIMNDYSKSLESISLISGKKTKRKNTK